MEYLDNTIYRTCNDNLSTELLELNLKLGKTVGHKEYILFLLAYGYKRF